MTKVFIHGLKSSSKGTKALFFKERYPEMIVSDFEGGRNVPFGPVREIAEKGFFNLTFHVVDDDHFLHKTFRRINWDNLLGS